DLADAQAIRVRMLLGLEDARDGKRRQLLRGIVDAFNLEPNRRQLVRKLFKRGVRIEMVLEPGQSEFHCVLRPAGLEDFPVYPGTFGVCVLPVCRGAAKGYVTRITEAGCCSGRTFVAPSGSFRRSRRTRARS